MEEPLRQNVIIFFALLVLRRNPYYNGRASKTFMNNSALLLAETSRNPYYNGRASKTDCSIQDLTECEWSQSLL